MIFTETERAFYCLQPAAGEHCGRPKGHADDCCTEALQEDIVVFQDAREGEVWETVRDLIIIEVNENRLSLEAANVVLAALDLEEAK